tara:strand:- start:101 stop:382 length:282 start_codon:yes stop_codon:yes gene_type:complete
MKYIKCLINFLVEKFFKINKAKFIKAKNIMIKAEEFNLNNLNLGNTYKVNEEVLVNDFISKILDEKFTIVVVDIKGLTVGYINDKQLQLFNKN